MQRLVRLRRLVVPRALTPARLASLARTVPVSLLVLTLVPLTGSSAMSTSARPLTPSGGPAGRGILSSPATGAPNGGGTVTLSSPSQTQVSVDLIEPIRYRHTGPTRQGGRFVDFAIPPNAPHVVYAATASGGLWKSVNNGLTWEITFDDPDVFSMGAVALAPSNPDIVWVGTGEANNSRSSYWGNGVYKSTDAGQTWQHMGLPESQHVGRIRIHPTNPDIVYVAALGHLYSDNPERGLYKTTDGGRTWGLVLTAVIEPSGRFENETTRHIGVVDVVMDPRDPDVLYAATYDKVRRPWTFNEGGPGSRIYKSTDGGANWEMLTEGLPSGMLGRIGLDVAASDPDVVFATIEDVNVEGMSDDERYQALLDGRPVEGRDNNDRLWRSDDAGRTWRAVSPEDQHVGGSPPYYYGRVIVDPNDIDHIFVLAAGSQVTHDGGATWERAFRGIGGDDHALWINPDDSDHMVLGYDHGMGITFDGGEAWYHPDDMPLAQFYAVGVDMAYPYYVYGGLQDNGSVRGPSTKRGGGPIWFEDWERVGGGDGMYNVVDWSNNRYLYNESQFGPIARLDMLTGERKSIRYERPGTGRGGRGGRGGGGGGPEAGGPEGDQPEPLRWNWNAPIHVSWHDSDVIYHAANVVLRSPFRGESWEEISPDLTTNDPAKIRGTGNIRYCTIVSFAESPIIADVLWAGTDDGNVWVTRGLGESWTKLNDNIPNDPGYWVSRVEASWHDPAVAYVSYTGYRRDDFRPFLYKTTDYGQTWTSISNGLPDEPINVVREDDENPNLLFVGTEMGVYFSMDGGLSWTSLRQNMPTQPVHDMKIHPREDDLVVATHGQGIFIADISPLQELTPEVLESSAHLFDVMDEVLWVDNDRKNVSSQQHFRGESEPEGVVINYWLSEPAASTPTVEVYQGSRLINVIEGTNERGLNQVIWENTKRRERTEEERAEFQRLQEQFGGRGGRGGGRGFGRGGNLDPDFVYEPAGPGDYRVVLVVGGQRFEKTARILKDHWYDIVER